MLDKYAKPFMTLIVLTLIGWTGFRIYQYYTHQQAPSIWLEGIVAGGYYKETVNAKVLANNGYKIATIDVTLDNKPFNDFTSRINSKSFSKPLTLNTAQLEDGAHELCFSICDASLKKNKATLTIPFNVDNAALEAVFAEQTFRVDQGKTAHIKIQANKKLDKVTVSCLAKSYACYQDSAESTMYECFIPIDCEEKAGQHTLVAEIFDHVGNTTKLSTYLTINAFDFPRQKGFSVDAQKLENEKEVSMSDKILNEAIEKWLIDSPKKKLWNGAFELPILVRKQTTPFGEIRTTPERGRYLHKGVDLINMPKSVIWASQNGKIIIKDRYLLTGNTIVIDHGLGVTTLYAHLDSFADVEVGDFVKKGNPIGKLGMSGYAAGYHLHWELRVNNIGVDPIQWTTTVY